MKQKYTGFYILVIYLLVQLSGAVFLLPFYNWMQANNPNLEQQQLEQLTKGWYFFLSMGIGLLISLLVIRFDRQFFRNMPTRMNMPASILWGIFGFVLVLLGQIIASNIEMLFGAKAESDNTTNLLNIASLAPVMVVAIVIFGPILEELVFRRVIFGYLYSKIGFWFAAILSAFIFAVMHNDFEHLLLYIVMGVILAGLYKKTGRISTSMIAHILLNALVTLQ